jgi:hypothetical protein
MLHAGFLLGLFFGPEEGECSSETSVDFQRTTQRYIPKDSTLHKHRSENLKSYTTLSENLPVDLRTICPTVQALIPGHGQTGVHDLHINPSIYSLNNVCKLKS